jgi:predicted S18 family serine protease
MRKSGNFVITLLLFVLLFFAMGALFELPAPTKYTETKIVYQTVKEYINSTIEVPVGQIHEKNITVYGVAVFNDTRGGDIVAINLFMRAGYGGTFLDVSGKTFGADFQETLPLIRSYAQEFTGQNLVYKDLIIRIDTVAENIQGSSGSAAIEIGLIAMLQDKTLKNDTIVTGILQPDGTLAAVSALDSKIAVAKSLGVKELLIPKVQCALVNESQKTGIIIDCVNSISDALEHMTA